MPNVRAQGETLSPNAMPRDLPGTGQHSDDMQASRLIRSNARRRHSLGDRSCLGVEITDFGLT